MQESSMISAFAELLASRLSFNPLLARCVRQEVEDHLSEAVAAVPADNRREAEQRAIANFGDPDVIAGQFAVAWLTQQTRKAGVAVVLAIAGVFVAMKARVGWYAVTQWALPDHMRAVGGVVGSIDAYAFWISLIVGLAGWAYSASRPIPTAFDPAYGKQLRLFFYLFCGAVVALVVSVISDGLLTTLRLFGTELSAEFLIPILSMAIEIACVGFLIFRIRGIAQRTAHAAALLKT